MPIYPRWSLQQRYATSERAFIFYLLLVLILFTALFFTQQSALRALQKEPLPITKGPIQLAGTLASESGAEQRPLCYISDDNAATGESEWSGTYYSEAVLVTPDGKRYPLDVNLNTRWESPPRSKEPLPPDELLSWRAKRQEKPKGEFVSRCLVAGSPISVGGCLVGTSLEDCPGAGLVLSPEEPDDLFLPMLGSTIWLVFLSLVGALLLSLGTYIEGSSLIGELLRWQSEFSAASLLRSIQKGILLLVVLVLLDLIFIGGHPAICVWLISGLLVGVAIIRLLLLRLDLKRAALPVLRAPTIPLSGVKSTSQLAELAVAAKDLAATNGPLSGRALSWWGLRVKHHYKSHKHHVSYELVTKDSGPMLKIQDSSGEGILDLTHAFLELSVERAMFSVHLSDEKKASFFLDGKTLDKGSLSVSEVNIEEGEALYILGNVVALKPSEQEGEYREASAIPVLGGTAERPLIVYSGRERGLLRALRWALRTSLLRLSALVLLEAIQAYLFFIYYR